MKKYALITGASSGIGFEFAKIYASMGYNLIITSRREDNLKEKQKILKEKYNVNIIPINKDLSHYGAAKDLYDKVKENNVVIDVLINNAGFGILGEFLETPIEESLELFNLNMTAVMELSYLFGNDMKKSKSGKILNVASIAGFQPGPYMNMYYASKAFVLNFTEALHNELKPYNVSVTALCPGPVKTNFENRAKMKDRSLMFKKMFVSDPKSVAENGYKALEKNRAFYTSHFVNKVVVFSNRLFPRAFMRRLTGWINKGKF